MLLVFFGESISFTTSYSFFTYKNFFLSFQTKKNCVNKLHVTLFFYSSRLSALHRATEIESQENVCSKLVENAKCSWNIFPKTCVEIGKSKFGMKNVLVKEKNR